MKSSELHCPFPGQDWWEIARICSMSKWKVPVKLVRKYLCSENNLTYTIRKICNYVCTNICIYIYVVYSWTHLPTQSLSSLFADSVLGNSPTNCNWFVIPQTNICCTFTAIHRHMQGRKHLSYPTYILSWGPAMSHCLFSVNCHILSVIFAFYLMLSPLFLCSLIYGLKWPANTVLKV